MIDFRLRRPASGKPKKADTAARVAEIVGSSLRDIRRRQGHSLDTLAAASGVSRAMLGQIETGKSVPTITVLWKIATALDVPLAQLITDPDVSPYTIVRRGEGDAKGATADAIRRSLTHSDIAAHYSLEEIALAAGHKEKGTARREGGAASAVVASGTVSFEIGGQEPVLLAAGDAIHFSAGFEHSFASSGDEPAVIYLFVVPQRNGR